MHDMYQHIILFHLKNKHNLIILVLFNIEFQDSIRESQSNTHLIIRMNNKLVEPYPHISLFYLFNCYQNIV